MQIEAARLFYFTLRNSGNATVQAPWGSGKTIVMLGCLAWAIGQNPNIRIKLVSATNTVAIKRSIALRDWIEKDEDFRRIFPGIAKSDSEWGKTSWTVQRKVAATDPTVSCYGIGSTDIGGRADILFFDDPCDRTDIDSAVTRLSRINAARNTWLRAIDEGGCFFCIATPWHSKDLIATLAANEDDKDINNWEIE